MGTAAEDLSRAFGFLYLEEVALLKRIAHGLPKKSVFVNVGAGVGNSSLAVLEERPDLAPYAHTIDISEGGPLGGLQNEVNAFNIASLGHLLPHQHLGDSAKVASEWDGTKIDFLFIDDGHLEQDIRRDIDSWVKYVNIGGLIGFHDYTSVHWPAVVMVVDEFIKNMKYMRLELARTLLIVKKDWAVKVTPEPTFPDSDVTTTRRPRKTRSK